MISLPVKLRNMYFTRRMLRFVSLLGLTPMSVSRSRGLHHHTKTLAHYSWMSQHTRGFPVAGDQVQFLHSPTSFYETLKEQIQNAKSRIVIASLYLGTGKLEEELVASISQTLSTRPEVKVDILLDCTRGTRGKENSCSMLQSLLNKYTDQVTVHLYHTPDLRGFLRRILPERFNETVGVQHMKIYLFDDDVIFSGANLSESYFTNRQDRYVLIKNTRHLADYFSLLVEAVSSVSFRLNQDLSLKLHESLSVHPYMGSNNGDDFRAEARKRVMRVIQSPWQPTNNKDLKNQNTALRSDSDSVTESCGADTVVYPLVQMAPFDISQDQTVTEEFLKTALRDSNIHLASGYFNLTSHYRELILDHSKANYQILTAAPEANGFYGSRGISGAIPDAYNYIENKFLHDVSEKNQSHRIRLQEYSRTGWTFHAKGLWHVLPGHVNPSATFIGSPNFGYRSVYRDLETQVVIATGNKDLQQRMSQEQHYVYDQSSEVTNNTFDQPERHVPLWVSYVTPLIANFF